MDTLEYFQLRADPFSHAPVSEFYFASAQHTEALNRLGMAARGMRGLALLIGDVGRGKSTLARRLLESLPESEFEAAMLVVVHASAGAAWVLRRVALQMGVEAPSDDPLKLLSQLYAQLIKIHESGRRAVVLIDEAQMLSSRELMEELRGLLNLEVPGHKLITFIFFGLPQLEENLKLDPPLAQRVAVRCCLKALGGSETAAYVRHRLAAAGTKEEIFSGAALGEIHRFTDGVPRLINTLCDNVLVDLFFARRRLAEAEHVQQAAANLNMTAHDTLPATVPTPAPMPDGLAVMPRYAGDFNMAEQAAKLAAAVAIEGEPREAKPGPSAAEQSVETPGNSWPGVRPMAPYLGNHAPSPVENRHQARSTDPSSDLLANVDSLLAGLKKSRE